MHGYIQKLELLAMQALLGLPGSILKPSWLDLGFIPELSWGFPGAMGVCTATFKTGVPLQALSEPSLGPSSGHLGAMLEVILRPSLLLSWGHLGGLRGVRTATAPSNM